MWQKHLSAIFSGLVASYDAVFAGLNAPSEQILPGSIAAFKSSDGSQLWSSQLNGSVSLEVMAHGILFGTVFAPSSTPDTQTALFALKSSDGSQIWRTSVAVPLSVFIGYITADTNSVFATYPFPMGSNGEAHSEIYAFTAETGEQKWVHTISPQPSPPAIDNGVVYIGVGYGYETYPGVWAIDPSNGNIKWTFRTEDQVFLRPLVTLRLVLRPAASRPDFTWTSYTVSNEERTLSPVGRAIRPTTGWIDLHPDTFCTLGSGRSIGTQRWRLFFTASKLRWSLCTGVTRSCFYAAPFVLQPVHDSVVQGTSVCSLSFFLEETKVEAARALRQDTPHPMGSAPQGSAPG
jgi:hypothetical protein